MFIVQFFILKNVYFKISLLTITVKLKQFDIKATCFDQSWLFLRPSFVTVRTCDVT